MTDEEKNETTEETPETPEAEAPAPEAPEPEAQLSPKERRKRERSLHTGESSAPRTIEDRIAARASKRAKNAAERRRWRAKQKERRRAAGPREGTPPAEKHPGTGGARERQGVVVSDKADKTITVRIDVARQHRTYGKIVRSSSTLHAHDERNEASAGDKVRVVESRPLSKSKRWRLVEVIEKAR